MLLFDETLNKDLQKKVDLLVRIWDIDKISSRYLTSVFIGHGAAVDLENVMNLHVKNKLGYGNIIQLSMDGPNVNWALFDRLQETLDAEYDHKLINIGSCGLHTLHNRFRDGAQSTDWGIGGILDALYRLFKDVPARREDYINATGNNESQFPLKFCQHRWVENVIVANRAMEIRENIESYVTSVSNKECKDPCTKSFETVKQWIADPLGKAKLAFFVYVATPIELFLRIYQTDYPMIPYRANDLGLVFKTLLNRMITSEVMAEAGDDCYKLIKIDTSNKANLRSLKNIDVGFVAAAELKKKPGSERDRLEFRQACRRFILTIIDKLKKKSPLNYSLVRNLSCLDPMEITNKTDLCESKFRKVLQLMVDIRRMKITEVRVFDKAKSRLDKLYYSVMGTNEEYKKVWSVVRKLLLLSHGQASVERSFSINKKITTQNLSEDTLIAKRAIKDYILHIGGLKNLVITNEILNSVQLARRRYSQHLEEKKQMKTTKDQNSKRKREEDTLLEMKKKLKVLQDDEKMLNAEVDKLYTEAKPSKSYQFVVKANGMRQKAKDKAAEIDHLEEGINQKEKELLDMRWLVMVRIMIILLMHDVHFIMRRMLAWGVKYSMQH